MEKLGFYGALRVACLFEKSHMALLESDIPVMFWSDLSDYVRILAVKNRFYA
ncbi:hypothetical protein L4C38_07135 [Vibrio kasasachensis]|uniref:hypothetical protein n=1 Tax=Vibrio kasasachensis TaxID=2910248 RepID=UPI003D10D74D